MIFILDIENTIIKMKKQVVQIGVKRKKKNQTPT